MSDHGFASPTAEAAYADPAAAVAAAAASAVGDGQQRVGGIVARCLSGVNGWTALLALLLVLVAYDQLRYLWNKGSITGPSLKIPFMGPFLESVYPEFDAYKRKWASGELSCISVFHKFVVIASSRDMARKVLNSPTYVKPCVVDVAHKLLRPTNWVFMDGRHHVDYRKGLNGLFARSSLQLYLPGQEEVYDKYLRKFVRISTEHDQRPFPFMPVFRELNCAVSCRTFVGHYMSDATVKKIADDYYRITAALELVNFPIILPFTKTWYGKKAADMVLDEFAKCAAKSKVRMRAGGEVTCIMDGWIKSMIESEEYRQKVAKVGAEGAEPKPATLLRVFTDFEISQTIFTFLFASQDASSSAMTWLFQLLADRPDVFERVREENLRVRDGDRDKPLSMDMLESMKYTRAVVKETLRYRPPVIMVPYVVKKTFPVTDTYTAPKGMFDPDRWITGDAEKATKNWLVFGTGPHYCLGQTYAQLHLMGMIGKAALHLDWVHHPTAVSEKIKVFATIFPQDDCLLVFSPRGEN
ncbi:MAG: RNA polymerase C-22 sterol desaturase [Lichina confinis]|nr:MAG: RNA polymerase C-22 sterol desaturase [Lichina confinis]